MFRLSLLVFLTALLADTALPQGPPATLVVTGEVRSMEFHDQVRLVGRTEAIRGGNVVSEISGRVIGVNSAEGVAIKKNVPLVTIDSKRLAFSLESRDAEAVQAGIQAELAKTLAVRAEELYQKKLISESAIDSARAYAAITRETYRKLRAERDQLALDVALGY